MIVFNTFVFGTPEYIKPQIFRLQEATFWLITFWIKLKKQDQNQNQNQNHHSMKAYQIGGMIIRKIIDI
jgi:hypothetical protein